ncbi:UNVERIFIED_CONTAM: hypothetical protein K2H54_049364 [Gekko kuhli]
MHWKPGNVKEERCGSQGDWRPRYVGLLASKKRIFEVRPLPDPCTHRHDSQIRRGRGASLGGGSPSGRQGLLPRASLGGLLQRPQNEHLQDGADIDGPTLFSDYRDRQSLRRIAPPYPRQSQFIQRAQSSPKRSISPNAIRSNGGTSSKRSPLPPRSEVLPLGRIVFLTRPGTPVSSGKSRAARIDSLFYRVLQQLSSCLSGISQGGLAFYRPFAPCFPSRLPDSGPTRPLRRRTGQIVAGSFISSYKAAVRGVYHKILNTIKSKTPPYAK